MMKEQREYVAEHLRNLIHHDEIENDESDLSAFRAALMLLTDEAEADRRLGAAVRAAFDGTSKKKAIRLARTIASECDDGSFSQLVFAAIAKALREEESR